jgi:hypothetical protein
MTCILQFERPPGHFLSEFVVQDVVYVIQCLLFRNKIMEEGGSDQQEGPLGEGVQSQWSWNPVQPITLEAGEMLLPVKLSTDNARKYASIQLIKADLEFARDCLVEADKLGIPNDSILSSKALIFAGVVAYARAFGTGARGVSFTPEEVTQKGVEFDLEIHRYLINLRNKHAWQESSKWRHRIHNETQHRACSASTTKSR